MQVALGMAEVGVTMIEIASLHQATIETQRPRLSGDSIALYMETLDAADPVLVYEHKVSGERILVDGHHRVEAAHRLGRTMIKAQVQPGNREDALRYLDQRGQST